MFSSYDLDVLQEKDIVDIFDSKTARMFPYRNIGKKKKLYRVQELSSNSKDNALVDLRKTSLIWILRQEVKFISSRIVI